MQLAQAMAVAPDRMVVNPSDSLMVRAKTMAPGSAAAALAEAAARAKRRAAEKQWEKEVVRREQQREKMREQARALTEERRAGLVTKQRATKVDDIPTTPRGMRSERAPISSTTRGANRSMPSSSNKSIARMVAIHVGN